MLPKNRTGEFQVNCSGMTAQELVNPRSPLWQWKGVPAKKLSPAIKLFFFFSLHSYEPLGSLPPVRTKCQGDEGRTKHPNMIRARFAESDGVTTQTI